MARKADKTKRYTAAIMFEELNNMANENQFDKYEIPKLQIIYGWITTYAAVFKKKNAERTLLEINISSKPSKK